MTKLRWIPPKGAPYSSRDVSDHITAVRRAAEGAKARGDKAAAARLWKEFSRLVAARRGLKRGGMHTAI